MTSKVLVKLPIVPFSQRKKPPPEIIPLPNRNDEAEGGERLQGHGVDRVTQLEQNLKFLQDQHQATLIALHHEVEALRESNRDLQFKLVFSEDRDAKGLSSAKEAEDHGSAKADIESPATTKSTTSPIEVETLRKDLQDVKINLDEAKRRNVHLSEVIEKLKKSLESKDQRSKERPKPLAEVGVQVDRALESEKVELQARLDDAKVLMKKMLQKNIDQYEEIATMKSAAAPYRDGRDNNAASKSGSNQCRKYQQVNNPRPTKELQSHEESYHKFPLLQTQSYWHRASRGNHSYEHKPHSGYRRNSRHHQERQDVETETDNGTMVLPQLQSGSVRVGKNSNYPNNFKCRVQGGGGGGGHYYGEDRSNRRYRGQKVHREYREPRDQDTREYHREFKYREPKENQRQQQRDFSDSSKEMCNYMNAQRQ